MPIVWDMHRWETSHQLYILKDYIQLMEAQFEKVKNEELITIRKRPKFENEVEYHEWQSIVDYQEMIFEEQMPTKLRYSFVVQIWIIVENRLNELCSEIKSRNKLDINANEFKGSQIEKAKIFLKKVAKINLEQSQWTKVKQFQLIRDCIIHADGNIRKSNKASTLRDYVKAASGIEINQNGNIFISKDFIESHLLLVKGFFDSIYNEAGFGPENIVVT